MKKLTVLLSILTSFAMLTPAAYANVGVGGSAWANGDGHEASTFRRGGRGGRGWRRGRAVCVARNAFGRRFRAQARGFRAVRKASRRALRKCINRSWHPRGKRTCRVVRCHRAGRGRW